MEFKDKYTTTAIAEKDKVVLSSDAYAIGEMIEKLINKLEQLRLCSK
jgi:hypothetical protein